MLVLSRKLNETIVINDDIVLTLLEVRRGKALLGVSAPREMPVVRGELLDVASNVVESEDVRPAEVVGAMTAIA